MDTSPRWSTNTKLIVMLAVLVVVGSFLVRFQVLIVPLIMAVILAYLLNPAITAMAKHMRISRTSAVLILYAILILLLIGLISGAGLLLQQQISGVIFTVTMFINSIPDWIEGLSQKPVTIGPFTFDFSGTDAALLQNTLLPTARDWLGRMTNWLGGFASRLAAFLGWTAFAFAVTFYLLQDIKAVQSGLLRIVPQGFQKDAERLFQELVPIWNAFLRGQLLLSLIMGTAIGTAMSILGVRYSLVLGVMAALAEFVPIIGANVVALTAALIALFQPYNWLGLPPLVHALVVVATSGVLQQLEANFLIPRIMGRQLKLHPAVLIIGAFIGFSLTGLTGLLLAAPIIATVRLFARYMRAKLFNLPPWPDAEEEPPPAAKAASVRIRPARESDRKDMLELSAQMWEGHDYIPQVWTRWLSDRRGVLLAAEAEGRMVGFGKLSRLGPKEWWLEGLRVHPEYQGAGIASQLTERLLVQWKRRGGGVIRLATSSERVQVHHLCDRLGFRRVAVCRVMAAPSAGRGVCEFESLPDGDAEEALAIWNSNAAAWGIPELVNDGRRWSRFSGERLTEFIRRRRAWWWRERSAILLAHDSDHADQPGLEVAALLAPPDKLTPILRQLRLLARDQKADRVAWVMPDNPRAVQAAKRAGFAEAWNAQLWLFERSDESPNLISHPSTEA
jgi:predicted PurR-regulated permease PerM/GNAT superfamily N-acetyltransferase